MIRPLFFLALAMASPAVAQEAFEVAPVSDTALRVIAGRADTSMLARSEQTSAVSENSVGDNVATGDVRIDAQAFQNLQGLSLLNVNTGNNVSMNSAMNVNIAINPGQ
ncbi:hypothetical protein [Sphingomonas sp.]|jgi:hypothetical protein|uniref:hypothetical protein n=1 Tax=Sphingomonas sp. TaxID=28214 RepID=UPI002DE5FA16|nr:hypothetical protein [Sphingomonas sp.]